MWPCRELGGERYSRKADEKQLNIKFSRGNKLLFPLTICSVRFLLRQFTNFIPRILLLPPLPRLQFLLVGLPIQPKLHYYCHSATVNRTSGAYCVLMKCSTVHDSPWLLVTIALWNLFIVDCSEEFRNVRYGDVYINISLAVLPLRLKTRAERQRSHNRWHCVYDNCIIL